jgi:hypothetical protein
MQPITPPRCLVLAVVTSLAAGSAQARAPQDLLDQIHPRSFVAYTASFGNESLEINNVGALETNELDDSSLSHDLRYEGFSSSQIGFIIDLNYRSVDEVDFEDLGPLADFTTTDAFVGLSYRALVDDDWRIPVRFGPYLHAFDLDLIGGSSVEYRQLGLRLSAEPEWILYQSSGERPSEFSAFLGLSAGAGASEIEDDDASETGYGFTFDAEVGVRWTTSGGLMLGLSASNSKANFGATDSYDEGTVFNPIDSDFIAFGVSIGWRG